MSVTLQPLHAPFRDPSSEFFRADRRTRVGERLGNFRRPQRPLVPGDLHPISRTARNPESEDKPEIAMSAQQMIEEAKECRVRARSATRQESELLLAMADAFDEIASAAEARKAVEENRCW